MTSSYRITLLPGDGIGPEVMKEVEAIIAERLQGLVTLTSAPNAGSFFQNAPTSA